MLIGQCEELDIVLIEKYIKLQLIHTLMITSKIITYYM